MRVENLLKLIYRLAGPGILMLALCLAACSSSENTLSNTLGWVNFNLSVEEVEGLPSGGVFSLTMTSADSVYSHHWENIADFSATEPFIIGSYRAVATCGDPSAEGYDCQCYQAIKDFEIVGFEHSEVPLTCTLAQAMMRVSLDPSLSEAYPSASATFHTSGAGYVAYDEQAASPLLLTPGKTNLYISLKNEEGDSVTLAPNFALLTKAAETANVQLACADSTLVITAGQTAVTLPLTRDIFTGAAPTIADQGFVSGEAITLTEGYPATDPVRMIVEAPAGLAALVLTSTGNTEAFESIPAECDLLQPAPELSALGLSVIKEGSTRCTVDFTKILESLSVTANSSVSFTLLARDALGRVSQPSTLKVGISSVDFGLISKTAAIVGEDVASVTLALNSEKVEAYDFSVFITDEAGRKKNQVEILKSETDIENRTITLSFQVGEGTADVPVLIEYMGNPKLYTVINRAVGEYKVTADAFALSTLLTVQGADSATTAAIVKMATVLCKGKEVSVDTRIPSTGEMRLVGLDPSTSYIFSLQLVKGGFAPEVTVTTESTAQLPDPDFEDVDKLFSYSKLPCGGVYSASSFPVFNMQNYSSIYVMWVQESWSSVNDKTFCMKASNHNTWYMQPSGRMDYDSYKAGKKSVLLTSVGWSLHGEEIQPYMQSPGESLGYNANIPAVEHVSAGRLFLGGYSFDAATCKETYKDGLGFSSRPSALSGYYKYEPVATDGAPDYGWAEVQLLSELTDPPTVLAHSTLKLAPSPDFVAFSLPITYIVPNMKATKIKVMFASSWKCGTIEEEDLNVTVRPDAQSASYTGSKLWIDDLTLSYAY